MTGKFSAFPTTLFPSKEMGLNPGSLAPESTTLTTRRQICLVGDHYESVKIGFYVARKLETRNQVNFSFVFGIFIWGFKAALVDKSMFSNRALKVGTARSGKKKTGQGLEKVEILLFFFLLINLFIFLPSNLFLFASLFYRLRQSCCIGSLFQRAKKIVEKISHRFFLELPTRSTCLVQNQVNLMSGTNTDMQGN